MSTPPASQRDFTLPYPSPALITPTSFTPNAPAVFDPFSDALQQMSQYARPLKQSPPTMAPPQLSASYPPPNIFYGSDQHLYPPPIEHDRHRPPMGLAMPPPSFEPSYPFSYVNPGHQSFGSQSPYQTPNGHHLNPVSGGSSSSQAMSEYFPPYSQPHSMPTPSPTYPAGRSAKSNSVGGKTGRQQFSACGACRHRRVKCDLNQKQDADKSRKKAICSNCEERGIACIDEYAPIKAAKQLRRGKRISEIEVLYGRAGSSAATPVQGVLPELTQGFFESAFFRRFQVQRPVLDPRDFSQRYLASHTPCAAAMGPEGAILCHVLYAWALSYGVDENGQLDVPEGGGEPLGPLSLSNPSENEARREVDRQRRFQRMREAVDVILREIDECGIMRKPSWDGVRVLLLVLPLTEGISTSVERLAMYETALNQVYTLCSFAGVGYDGQPSATSGVNGGSDNNGQQNIQLIRVRIYWYAFVHEGITTGLKGGRLLLDDEDLETMQDSIQNRALVVANSAFQTTVKFATAPINLALACRLINRALTGPSARRAKTVNSVWVKEAWEALEKSWEEFEALKFAPDASSLYSSMDEVLRFADGWKIFLFEAQNVIRKILEERYAKLAGSSEAHISDADAPFGADRLSELASLQRLADISRSKCDVKCRQILEMVRRHAGSRFFEWDASLVRDGTYYAAKLMAQQGNAQEDIAVCLQALNELRWAHAKAMDRSAELRRDWAASVSPQQLGTWDTYPPTQTWNSLDSNNSLSGSGSPYHSPGVHGGFPRDMPQPYLANLDPSTIPRAGIDMNKAHWTTSAAMDQSTASFAVYGHMPGPPLLGTHTGLGYQDGVGGYDYGLNQ